MKNMSKTSKIIKIESKIKNFKSQFEKKCENPKCNNIIIVPNPAQKYCPECGDYRDKIREEKQKSHYKENPYGVSERTKRKRLIINLKNSLLYSFNHSFCKYYTYERQVNERIKNVLNTKLAKQLIDLDEQLLEKDVLFEIFKDINNKKRILNELSKKINKEIDKIC